MSIADEPRRRPVWMALADLYLDTELQEADLQHMAAVCAASDFSWAEVQQLNYNEVAPALWFNVQDVAGEWAGWKEDWLIERIRHCYQTVPRRHFGAAKCWQKRVDLVTREALARVAAYLP